MRLQKGVYYIGDLCYVMHPEWDEVCQLLEGDQYPNEGQFRLSDGRQFAMFNTAYGDGEYYDKQGRAYCVDSGSLGCIKVENLTEEVDEALGNSCTKGGFQTKNIMNDASIEDILHKILNYLPYPNDYQYRWFHMIDYEQGGSQEAHHHARTENYSYVLYLTSCNHGGETCFKLDQEIQIKPKKNTLIFFPSTILHWGKTTIDHKKVAVGALIGNFK